MCDDNEDTECLRDEDESAATVGQCSVRALAQRFEAMASDGGDYPSGGTLQRPRGPWKSGSSTGSSAETIDLSLDDGGGAHRHDDDDDASPNVHSEGEPSDDEVEHEADTLTNGSGWRVQQMARHFERLSNQTPDHPSSEHLADTMLTDEEVAGEDEASGSCGSVDDRADDAGVEETLCFGDSGSDVEPEAIVGRRSFVHSLSSQSQPQRAAEEIAPDSIQADSECELSSIESFVLNHRRLSQLFGRQSTQLGHLDASHDHRHEMGPIEAINATISHHDDSHSPVSDFTDSEFSDDEIEVAEEAINRQSIHTIVNQVPQIVGELLANEQLYIENLSRGIANYCSVYDDPTYILPATIRGQKYHIFGNIERIRDFHANTFYPSLQRCDTDVVQICETFCRFVEEHRFYMYVLYAINRKRADELTDRNRQFFADRQNLQQDKLGVNSFLVQPIQRLPRYQLLLRELIKELGKSLNVDGVKETIASCCRAEKHLQRLLDQVNSSMSINDIVDNTEIEILHQGKFRCMHEFDVYECDSRRRYRAKAFLFDKGVLLAEVIDKATLSYRGYYMSSRMGVFEQDSYKFELYDQLRFVRQIELSSDASNVALWVKLLRENVLREYNKRQQLSANGNTVQQRDSGISETSFDGQQQFVVVRSVGKRDPNSSESGSSNWTSGISDSSSVRSFDCDPRRTTWYTNVDSKLVSNGKTLERLINSEKHYILILTNYLKRFLLQIPDYRVPDHLAKYIRVVRKLIDFHTHHQYPLLCQHKESITDICATFRSSLSDPIFVEAYQVYAALSTRAYTVLDQIYTDGESEIEHFTNIPIEQLRRTSEFLDLLMVELKDADETFVSNEFKAVAVTDVQLNKFRGRVIDNLNLNSIKGINRMFLDEFGLVEYGEAVSIYGNRNRLLVLERGLVCVRTRISTKTLREKFIDVDFALPLSAVRTSESNRSASRLRFFANYARDIVFKVDFPTTALKLALQKRIEVVHNPEV